jgi:hypothetical protein
MLWICLLVGVALVSFSSPAVAQDDTEIAAVDTPEEIVVGESFPVEITVANHQRRRTNVTVQVSGETSDTVTVELRGKSERTVTLRPTAPPSRSQFDVAITLWERDGDSLPYVARRLSLEPNALQDEGGIAVRSLTPTQSVAPGRPVTVGFDIVNLGDSSVSESIELFVDGDRRWQSDITLSAGETHVEQFETQAPANGSITVSLRTGSNRSAEATVRAIDAPVTASIAAYDESDDQLIMKVRNTREQPTQAFLKLVRDPAGGTTVDVAQQTVDLSPRADQRVNVSIEQFDIGAGKWTLSLTQLIVDGEGVESLDEPIHSVHDPLVLESDNLAPSKQVEQKDGEPSELSRSRKSSELPFLLIGGTVGLVAVMVTGGYAIGTRIFG